MNLEFVLQILEKSSNIKFNENPSGRGGERVASHGQTDGRTAIWKPIISFYKFPRAPKYGIQSADFCAEFRENKQK